MPLRSEDLSYNFFFLLRPPFFLPLSSSFCYRHAQTKRDGNPTQASSINFRNFHYRSSVFAPFLLLRSHNISFFLSLTQRHEKRTRRNTHPHTTPTSWSPSLRVSASISAMMKTYLGCPSKMPQPFHPCHPYLPVAESQSKQASRSNACHSQQRENRGLRRLGSIVISEASSRSPSLLHSQRHLPPTHTLHQSRWPGSNLQIPLHH